MRRSTHTTSRLKLVMLFDGRNQTCCVCSHNLDAEDASQEVAELRRDGLPAFTVDQRSRHTEADPDEWLPVGRTSSSRSIRCRLLNARNGRPDSAARRLLKTHNRSRSTPVFSSRKPKSTNLGGVLCPKTATASLIILSWTKAFSAKPSSSKKSVIGYRWHSSGSASADRSRSPITPSSRTKAPRSQNPKLTPHQLPTHALIHSDPTTPHDGQRVLSSPIVRPPYTRKSTPNDTNKTHSPQ